MKRLTALILFVTLFLSGCSVWNGTYVQVRPSSGRTTGSTEGDAPVENEEQLRAALESLIDSGVENGVIYAVNMDAETLEAKTREAAEAIRAENAVSAYAVNRIDCEVGTVGGKTAAAISISYRRGTVEIRKILRVADAEEAKIVIGEALEDFTPRLVMLMEEYGELDAQQLVRTMARTDPQIVMEIPQVAQETYGSGVSRVLELSFSYSNSRENLRQMREQVQPVFDSAALYVTSDAQDTQKLSQLYAFLMERFDYTLETSITPAYSLLHHGVGDSRAFATVYSAMCRQAGLECLVVTGTRMGTSWTWNMVCDDGNYYHVDLLRDREKPTFEELTDSEMSGYVWDYSAYPACREKNGT